MTHRRDNDSPESREAKVTELSRAYAAALVSAFVVGGRGLTPRVRSQPGIEVCRRVSEAVEAVDGMVKHADLN